MSDETLDTKDETTDVPSAEVGEVGESPVNFTTAAGTTEEPAPSSDGTESDSSGSTTSPSPDAPASEGAETSPFGATGGADTSDAPDASSNAIGSDIAPSTPANDGDDADVSDDDAGDTGSDDNKSTEDAIQDAKAALKGEHADGHGPTHIGTDTPERLISNPYNDDTGMPLFAEDNHSDEPLPPGAFDDASEDGVKEKLSRALELLNEIGETLG